MTPAYRFGLLLMVAVAALTTIGCQDEGKIRQLERERQFLISTNADLEQKLAQTQQANSNLDTELTRVRADVDQLRQDLYRTQGDYEAAQMAVTQVGAAGGDWVATSGGDMITVGSDILFGSGKAELTADGKRRLDRIVQDLTSTYSVRMIRVFGHTDSDPIRQTAKLWEDNLDLSSNRAMAVTRYLVARGIPLQRIETVGMADAKPVASNGTREGKAKNRRVEIYAVE